MDYFPNGDFSKSYPLPGISYYMSSLPANVPSGQPQQGILSLTTPTYEGQPFLDSLDYSALQHQQYAQPPPGLAVARQQPQYMVGQKRKSTYQHYQQHQQQDSGGMGVGEPLHKDGRKLDPFAPECSIPLPYQLGDEYRCVVENGRCAGTDVL